MASDAIEPEVMPIPVAVWEGEFMLMGVRLRCSVLDTGERVINADDVHEWMRVLHSGEGCPVDEAEVLRFAKWRSGVTP